MDGLAEGESETGSDIQPEASSTDLSITRSLVVESVMKDSSQPGFSNRSRKFQGVPKNGNARIRYVLYGFCASNTFQVGNIWLESIQFFFLLSNFDAIIFRRDIQ
jgi:hypothetical protein